jgi:hypothetical protein
LQRETDIKAIQNTLSTIINIPTKNIYEKLQNFLDTNKQDLGNSVSKEHTETTIITKEEIIWPVGDKCMSIIIKARINKAPITVFVDTGANLNLIKEETAREIRKHEHVTITPNTTRIVSESGEQIKNLGCIQTRLTLDRSERSTSGTNTSAEIFKVISVPEDIQFPGNALIGMKFIIENKWILNPHKNQIQSQSNEKICPMIEQKEVTQAHLQAEPQLHSERTEKQLSETRTKGNKSKQASTESTSHASHTYQINPAARSNIVNMIATKDYEIEPLTADIVGVQVQKNQATKELQQRKYTILVERNNTTGANTLIGQSINTVINNKTCIAIKNTSLHTKYFHKGDMITEAEVAEITSENSEEIITTKYTKKL